MAGVGHYLFIVAHRYAPASTIAPFLYITILTHSLAGYLVFGQVPDAFDFVSTNMIADGRLFHAYRSGEAKAPASAAEPPSGPPSIWASSSTRSAVRRSASSRSAVRFGGEKKCSSARSACFGT